MAGTTPAYLANKLAMHIYNLGTYTPPTTVYAALTVSDSTDAAAGTECSDANYARQPLTTASICTNSGAVDTNVLKQLWAAAAVSYVVHDIEFYDALTAGNRVLPYIVVSPNVTVPVNVQFEMPVSSETSTVS